MNWKDLEDSTELAEVLGLMASLVAAVMALRDAQKEKTKTEEQDHPEAGPLLPVSEINLEPKIGDRRFSHNHLVLVVIGLGTVVVFQLAIILFIAYKLL